jgi:hypothetical protein
MISSVALFQYTVMVLSARAAEVRAHNAMNNSHIDLIVRINSLILAQDGETNCVFTDGFVISLAPSSFSLSAY